MGDKYILRGREVVSADLKTWAQWFESADRHVALTEGKNYTVSTVFLGIDHRFGEGGPPLLFETMVFDRKAWNTGDMTELDQRRYSTIDEAERGHKKMVKKWETTP